HMARTEEGPAVHRFALVVDRTLDTHHVLHDGIVLDAARTCFVMSERRLEHLRGGCLGCGGFRSEHEGERTERRDGCGAESHEVLLVAGYRTVSGPAGVW